MQDTSFHSITLRIRGLYIFLWVIDDLFWGEAYKASIKTAFHLKATYSEFNRETPYFFQTTMI
jgi:hypothetical protein